MKTVVLRFYISWCLCFHVLEMASATGISRLSPISPANALLGAGKAIAVFTSGGDSQGMNYS